MMSVMELARRLGHVVGGTTQTRSVDCCTAAEVLQYLRPRGDDAPADLNRETRKFDLIDRVVASLPRVVTEEHLARHHPGFRRYFDALPRILFFHGRGFSPDEIAREMRFIATGYGVETVLGIVANTIARRVARFA